MTYTQNFIGLDEIHRRSGVIVGGFIFACGAGTDKISEGPITDFPRVAPRAD